MALFIKSKILGALSVGRLISHLSNKVFRAERPLSTKACFKDLTFNPLSEIMFLASLLFSSGDLVISRSCSLVLHCGTIFHTVVHCSTGPIAVTTVLKLNIRRGRREEVSLISDFNIKIRF